ncbi:MAG: hypothetical protein NZ693_08495, partial [Thermoflexales bacterium]|nr:hypothetical protein [Thermoflexales bacterium]
MRVLIAFALLLASSALTLVAPIQPSLSSTNYVVYSDALASGWQDWSWGGTYDLAHTGTVQSGSAAISATITSGYGGLSLRVDPGLPGSSYSAVQFWVHGGSSGTRQLQLVIEEGDSGPRTTPAHFDANAGSWTLVTIPLSALGNPATIKRINIEDRTGSGQPTFYVDEIILIAGSSATPTP